MGIKRLLATGPIFGRITGIEIDERDFANSKVIRTMSNGSSHTLEIRGNTASRFGVVSKITRGPQDRTTTTEVIEEILKKTHEDLPADQHEKLLAFMNNVAKEVTPGANNKDSVHNNKTDLIRGIEAFRLATHDRYGEIFDPTIIDPAREFASWLIDLETRA